MQTQAISVAQTAPIFSNNISTLYPLAEHSKISGSYGKIILAIVDLDREPAATLNLPINKSDAEAQGTTSLFFLFMLKIS
jgi:hypothetical protein